MPTDDLHLLLIALGGLAVIVLAVVLVPGRPRKSHDEKPEREISRWRVFRIRPRALHRKRAESEPVAVEETGGSRFLARYLHGSSWEIQIEGDGDAAEKSAGASDSKASSSKEKSSKSSRRHRRSSRRSRKRSPRLEICHRGIFSPRLQARLDGEEWLSVSPLDEKRSSPQIRYRRGGKSLKVDGRPLQRDYEVRRQGRLLALVTTDGDGDTARKKDRRSERDYRLEVLRGEDARPIVALVLTLEAAMPPLS